MWIILFIKEENKMLLVYMTSVLYMMVSMWILVFSKDKDRYLLSLVPYAIMVGGMMLRLTLVNLLPFPTTQVAVDTEAFVIVLTMGIIGYLLTSASALILNFVGKKN
jgi:hypothetical protein